MTNTTTDPATRTLELAAALEVANAECEKASAMDIAFYAAALGRRHAILAELNAIAADPLTPYEIALGACNAAIGA